MTYLTLQLIGGLTLAMVLGWLGYLFASVLRLHRRASRQLRWSREMRRTFEDELAQFPAHFVHMSSSAPLVVLPLLTATTPH